MSFLPAKRSPDSIIVGDKIEATYKTNDPENLLITKISKYKIDVFKSDTLIYFTTIDDYNKNNLTPITGCLVKKYYKIKRIN